MPLPVDNLTPDSSQQAIQDAISKSIQTCMQEPGDVKNKQEQCAAMAYSIARKKTGKQLGGEK